jgi:hypothetical protein
MFELLNRLRQRPDRQGQWQNLRRAFECSSREYARRNCARQHGARHTRRRNRTIRSEVGASAKASSPSRRWRKPAPRCEHAATGYDISAGTFRSLKLYLAQPYMQEPNNPSARENDLHSFHEITGSGDSRAGWNRDGRRVLPENRRRTARGSRVSGRALRPRGFIAGFPRRCGVAWLGERRLSTLRSQGNCASSMATASAAVCWGAAQSGTAWGGVGITVSWARRARWLRPKALPPRAPIRRSCKGDLLKKI